MRERDPRIDPMPGDVVLRADVNPRPFHVLKVEDDIVGRFGNGTRGSLCGLPYWRKWAANAEIIKRGEGRRRI
jgi:hypothetical protein